MVGVDSPQISPCRDLGLGDIVGSLLFGFVSDNSLLIPNISLQSMCG